MRETQTQTDVAPQARTQVVTSVVIAGHPDPTVVGARRIIGAEASLPLGRGDDCAFPGGFNDGKVSRQHARIDATTRGITVEDLGSRNGTWVDGVAITEPTPLKAGSILAIGRVVCVVEHGPLRYVKPTDPETLGISLAVAGLLREIEQVAPRLTSVTVLGETGVGKELVARALHRRSGRSGAMVALNCAGMRGELMTTTLFGHGRGAFTGAVGTRLGLIEKAERGSFFLDEIADAPGDFQALLLRVLETQRYRRVGEDNERTAEVRVVAGAQPRISAQVASGAFRTDLWNRLATVVLTVPPLSKRGADIPLLPRHFLAAHGEDPALLNTASVVALMRRAWPGNVRELSAVIERGVVAHDGSDLLEPGPWLDDPLRSATVADIAPAAGKKRKAPTPRPPRATIVQAFADNGGDVSKAAAAFGVNRRTLYRWASALDIDVSQSRTL
ncbi:MAG: DNA-binding NtrC family response regulator [Myxococcota bacterium]